MAFFVRETRINAAAAFANFARVDGGVDPVGIPEYFYWGSMKLDPNGNEVAGFHGVFVNDSTNAREHLFVVSQHLGEDGRFENIIHELAHHAGIRSEEGADAVVRCVKRNKRKERDRPGGGGGGIGGGGIGIGGGGGEGGMLSCEVEPAGGGGAVSCYRLILNGPPGEEMCVEVYDNDADGEEVYLYTICIIDHDGDGRYEVEYCYQKGGRVVSEIRCRLV